jgi:RNA-directed DNA polymerase
MTPLCGDTNTKTDLSNCADINCHKVKREVKRLRGRIFAAKSKKEFRKLRSLQRLMLKSSSNILLSIRHVTNNSGSKKYNLKMREPCTLKGVRTVPMEDIG